MYLMKNDHQTPLISMDHREQRFNNYNDDFDLEGGQVGGSQKIHQSDKYESGKKAGSKSQGPRRKSVENVRGLSKKAAQSKLHLNASERQNEKEAEAEEEQKRSREEKEAREKYLAEQNRHFTAESNEEACANLPMHRFIYRKFKREGRKLQPADLDSEDEARDDEFLRKKLEKEKQAAKKNADVQQLVDKIDEDLQRYEEDSRAGFTKREVVDAVEGEMEPKKVINFTAIRKMGKDARSAVVKQQQSLVSRVERRRKLEDSAQRAAEGDPLKSQVSLTASAMSSEDGAAAPLRAQTSFVGLPKRAPAKAVMASYVKVEDVDAPLTTQEEVTRRLDQAFKHDEQVFTALRHLRRGLKQVDRLRKQKRKQWRKDQKDADADKEVDQDKEDKKIQSAEKEGPKTDYKSKVRTDQRREKRPLAPWLKCLHGHEMEEVPMVKEKDQKDSDIIDCSHCLQPNIGIHMKHYQCSNPYCDIKIVQKDLSLLASPKQDSAGKRVRFNFDHEREAYTPDMEIPAGMKQRSNKYAVCETCALCSVKQKEGTNIQRTMKANFHEHFLHRHPIMNKNQWTCHCSMGNDAFRKWVNTTKLRYHENKCQSDITDIISDNRLYQGYECYQCDFDVCLKCLIKYKDVRSESEIDIENRRAFRRMLRHPELNTEQEREEKDPYYEKKHAAHEHHHAPLGSYPTFKEPKPKGSALLVNTSEPSSPHDLDEEKSDGESPLVDDHELKHQHGEEQQRFTYLNQLEEDEKQQQKIALHQIKHEEKQIKEETYQLLEESIDIMERKPEDEKNEKDKLKRLKPLDVFNSLQKEFVVRMIENERHKEQRYEESGMKYEQRLYKMNLKIRSYRAIKEDYTLGLLRCPNHPLQAVIKLGSSPNTKRSNQEDEQEYRPDNYINLFKIERKFIQIIEAVNRRESYLVVKTTESFIGKVGGAQNLIKTIRLYDTYNNYRLMDEILLEQINCYTYHPTIEKNYISILQNGFKIYFWRRRKSTDRYKLQLYMYDFDSRIQEMTKGGCESKALKKMEHYYFFEDIDKPQKHILFGQGLGPMFLQHIDDDEFLDKQFILQQNYDQELSMEEKLRQDDGQTNRRTIDSLRQSTSLYHHQDEENEEQLGNQYSVIRLGDVKKFNIKRESTENYKYKEPKNQFKLSLRKSRMPVANFFIKREEIMKEFTPKEKQERKDQGQSIEPYRYNKIDFIMIGEFYQHKQIQYPILKPIENYQDKEWYNKAKEVIQEKDGFQQNVQTYQDVVHDGAEVDSFHITVPQIPEKFEQFYLLTEHNINHKDQERIVLVHPNIFIEGDKTRREIIQQIKDKLGQDYCEHGKKLSMFASIRRSHTHASQTNTICNINNRLYKDVQDLCAKTIYTQQFPNYQQYAIDNANTQVMFDQNIYNTLMYINQKQYYNTQELLESHQIQVIKFTNAYKGTYQGIGDFQKPTIPTHDRLIIRNLFKQPLQSYLENKPRKLFINSNYLGIVSGLGMIETNMTQIKIEESQLQKGEKMKNEDKQNDQDKDEHILVHQWMGMAKMKLKNAQRKENYVFIEGSELITPEARSNKKNKKQLRPMSKQYYNLKDKDVRKILEDYDLQDLYTDEEEELNFNDEKSKKLKVKYWMIRIISDVNNKNVEFIQYWRTLKFYIFLFKYMRKTYFFTKLTIEQVCKLNYSTGNTACILHDQTPIYMITNVNAVKMSVFQTFKLSFSSHQVKANCHLVVQTEEVIDMKQQLDFIPFLCIEYHPADKDQVKKIHLNMFDVEKNIVIKSISCNPPGKDLKDTHIPHIQLCRTDSITIQRKRNKHDKDFREAEIMEQTQNTHFAVTFYFENQFGRFMIKEFALVHKYEKESERGISVQSKIQQIAQREIFVSQYEHRYFQLIRFKCIPFMDTRAEGIAGMRIIIEGNTEKQREHLQSASANKMQIINILDGADNEHNNCLLYKSKHIYYGYQRFFNDDVSFQESLRCYYLVLSAKFEPSYIDDKNLDQCETLLVLKQVIRQLYKILNFNFVRSLSTDYDQFKDRFFFMTQEMLHGKSFVDLHINQDKYIDNALKQGIDKISSLSGSLISQEIAGTPAREEKLRGNGCLLPNLAVSQDFNFINQIERGLEMNANISVNLLISKIFEIGHKQYRDALMQVLPKILQQDSIQIILPFLDRAPDDQECDAGGQMRQCNLESFFDMGLDLPDKSHAKRESFCQHTFDDANSIIEEVAKKIKIRDEKKKDQDELTIPVEHSYIDFQLMIIKNKLNQPEHDEKDYMFDHVQLSELMMQSEEQNVAFYEQDAIQKIIDYQFITTQKYFKRLGLLYVFFFLVPIFFIIFNRDPLLIRVCYIIAYFTQLIFFFIEIIQMKAQGWQYVKQLLNMADSIQFTVFIILMFNQFLFPYSQTQEIFQILLFIVLISQAFIKLLFFMKIFEEYGFLVQMIILSILDVRPFMAFFVIWVLFFTIIFQVMQMEFDESQYKGLPRFMKLFIHQMRNSLGDLQLPEYTAWSQKGDEFKSVVIIYVMWIVWFVNLILMLIILLNFLIAVISQTYEKVAGSKVSYTYKDKAEMNAECSTILKFVYQQGEVKMIVFSYDKSIWAADDRSWGGIVDSVKRIVGASSNAIANKITSMEENLSQGVAQLNTSQRQMESMVASIQKTTADLQHKMADQQERHNKEMKSLLTDVRDIKKHMLGDQRLGGQEADGKPRVVHESQHK